MVEQIDRIAELVGLTSRQVEAIGRYARGLEALGEMSRADIQDLVNARAQDWTQQRAQTIARTETVNAASSGQQARWDQELREGLLDHASTRRPRIRRGWRLRSLSGN